MKEYKKTQSVWRKKLNKSSETEMCVTSGRMLTNNPELNFGIKCSPVFPPVVFVQHIHSSLFAVFLFFLDFYE